MPDKTTKPLGLVIGVMVAAGWLSVAPADAQTSSAPAAPAASSAPAAPGAPGTCVQVQVAGQSAPGLACLNQQLQSQALAASGQSGPTAPLGAGSPANATGTFSKTGVAEQYGKNFGVSVVPYRPPPPAFSSAVH